MRRDTHGDRLSIECLSMNLIVTYGVEIPNYHQLDLSLKFNLNWNFSHHT